VRRDPRLDGRGAPRDLFDLTPGTIDTSRLPPGRYRITVTASDTGGNVAALTRVLVVEKGATYGPALADTRCIRD
jgi:hypothetical protein